MALKPYTYDKNGNRTSMTDATGTTTYTYDQLNRLRAVQQPRMYPTLYDYDNAGHVAKVTYTSGDTVEYTYNGQAMLSAAKVTMGGAAYSTTFEYDQYGLLKSKTLPNGLITTYAFDRANRVTSSVTTLGATTIASTSYPVYDGNSNLKHAVVNSRTIDYTYDAQNQLMIANTTSHASYERFTYDASGNRLTMTTPSGIANYTYDSDNRLVHTYGAVTNTVYVYDGDGNLTQKVTPDEVIQFTYNAANRLVGWTNGTSVVSFEYDGDGNRVSKTVDGEKTRYVNDVAGPVSQVMMELNDNYQVTAKYFYGGERLMQYRGAMAYYVYDAPGRSVIAMINTPSSVTNSYAYGAFGGITNATEPIYNDYLYDGEQYDEETGLIYLRNRYYDPEIGRFISKDPYPGELVNPMTINPYPFVGNNPVTRIDPNGDAYIYNRALLELPDFFVDTRLHHEQIFYSNGENIGFFKDGFHKETGGISKIYSSADYVIDGSPRYFNDLQMHYAVVAVKGSMNPTYSFCSNNCQDFAAAVVTAYDSIEKNQLSVPYWIYSTSPIFDNNISKGSDVVLGSADDIIGGPECE